LEIVVNKKPDKYIIGLTGNIATGKSLVLKMLSEMGAYTIDADTIAHRVIRSDGPAYQPILDTFGRWLLNEENEIDRGKLGKLVFADASALALLESIVHPAVEKAVDALLNTCAPEVVAIEAIKVLEGGIGPICDAIWVVDAPRETQIQRLVAKRGFAPDQAAVRVDLQGDGSDKRSKADVIIDNNGSAGQTWEQIAKAWSEIDPPSSRVPDVNDPLSPVRRALPADFNRLNTYLGSLANVDEMAYLFHTTRGQVTGAAGWYTENFIGHLSVIKVDPSTNTELAVRRLVSVVEQAAAALKNEVLFVYAPQKLPNGDQVLGELGYSQKNPNSDNTSSYNLGTRAWNEAVTRTAAMIENPKFVLWYKVINPERVLRPL